MRVSVFVTLTLVACASPSDSALRPGRSYRATLLVTNRGPILPEILAHLPEPQDTATVSLVVDSTSADSAFGRVQIDLHVLGTTGGNPIKPGALYDFEARTHDDSVELRLWPGATDQNVWLRGQVHDGALAGDWQTAYSPRVSGTFRIGL